MEDLRRQTGEVQPNGKIKTFTNIEQPILDNLDTQVQGIIDKILSAPFYSTEIKELTSSLYNIGNVEIEKTSNISNRMLSRPLMALR